MLHPVALVRCHRLPLTKLRSVADVWVTCLEKRGVQYQVCYTFIQTYIYWRNMSLCPKIERRLINCWVQEYLKQKPKCILKINHNLLRINVTAAVKFQTFILKVPDLLLDLFTGVQITETLHSFAYTSSFVFCIVHNISCCCLIVICFVF